MVVKTVLEELKRLRESADPTSFAELVALRDLINQDCVRELLSGVAVRLVAPAAPPAPAAKAPVVAPVVATLLPAAKAPAVTPVATSPLPAAAQMPPGKNNQKPKVSRGTLDPEQEYLCKLCLKRFLGSGSVDGTCPVNGCGHPGLTRISVETAQNAIETIKATEAAAVQRGRPVYAVITGPGRRVEQSPAPNNETFTEADDTLIGEIAEGAVPVSAPDASLQVNKRAKRKAAAKKTEEISPEEVEADPNKTWATERPDPTHKLKRGEMDLTTDYYSNDYLCDEKAC